MVVPVHEGATAGGETAEKAMPPLRREEASQDGREPLVLVELHQPQRAARPKQEEG